MKPELKEKLIKIVNVLNQYKSTIGYGLLAIVVVGLLLCPIVFLFAISPSPFVTVTNASLTQFKLTGNNLNYNLTLDLAFYNGNKKQAMQYKNVQVSAEYGKQDFAMSSLPPFRQRHQNTTVLHANLQDRPMMWFSQSALAQFRAESAAGVYSIDVEATMKVKEYVWFYKCAWICSLKLPLSSSDASPSPSSFRDVLCIKRRVRRGKKRRLTKKVERIRV